MARVASEVLPVLHAMPPCAGHPAAQPDGSKRKRQRKPDMERTARVLRTKFTAEAILKKEGAGATTTQIIEGVGTSLSTIKRARKYHREHGTARESKQGQGKQNDARWVFAGPDGRAQLDLLESVKQAGDAEDLLREVWAEFLATSPKAPAYRTLCDAVARLEYTRKRLSSLAREQDLLARNHFVLRVGTRHGAHQLVFVDETARDDRTLNRRYGYSKRGQPACGSNHFLLRGKRFSALGPFTVNGFLDWDVREGSYDADGFYNALVTRVLPHMQRYVDWRVRANRARAASISGAGACASSESARSRTDFCACIVSRCVPCVPRACRARRARIACSSSTAPPCTAPCASSMRATAPACCSTSCRRTVPTSTPSRTRSSRRSSSCASTARPCVTRSPRTRSRWRWSPSSPVAPAPPSAATAPGCRFFGCLRARGVFGCLWCVLYDVDYVYVRERFENGT